jgi:2-polyprenyl-3-methyl-5-hydroxy-6-metoxy-1,4-benzoquinol methylase
MPELEKGHLPFERDIEETGAYQYTDGSRFSAHIANGRFTEMILSCADFRGKTVVDVGSGDGTYTAEIAQRSEALSVLGIDPSPRAIERASFMFKSGFPRLQFKCGSSRMLLDEGHRFDIAVYRGVIHHVADPPEEIQRALSLTGKTIILEPNGLNLLVKLIEKLSKYHREHYERSFSPAKIGRWVREGGGEVKKSIFFGLVPHFCPDLIARVGRFLEPPVELMPGIRSLGCGQFLLLAQSCR